VKGRQGGGAEASAFMAGDRRWGKGLRLRESQARAQVQWTKREEWEETGVKGPGEEGE